MQGLWGGVEMQYHVGRSSCVPFAYLHSICIPKLWVMSANGILDAAPRAASPQVHTLHPLSSFCRTACPRPVLPQGQITCPPGVPVTAECKDIIQGAKQLGEVLTSLTSPSLWERACCRLDVVWVFMLLAAKLRC